MHAHAAYHESAVDDGNALTEFCGADRAFLPGRTAADYDEIEVRVSHSFTRYFDGF